MPVGHARLLSGGKLSCDLLPGPWRALYPWRETLNIRQGNRPAETLAPGEGRALGREAHSLVTEDPEARVFLWEIVGEGGPPPMPEGFVELLSHDMPLLPGETDGQVAALRFERVDLVPGIVTPRHTHRGSGLRVMIAGQIEAQVGERHLSLRPGDCWLEKGPGEPVIGRVIPAESTAFVRLLVLPEDCLHQDSFLFLDDGEAVRSRPAAYQLFHEERVLL